MTLSPAAQRRLLLALGALLALTTVAYLVVRSGSEDSDTLATAGAAVEPDGSSTTESPEPTTTTAPAARRTRQAPAVPPPTAPPRPDDEGDEDHRDGERRAPASTTTSTHPPRTVTSAPATAMSTPAPPFEASIHPVSAEELGASWTPGIGCTPPDQLRRLHLRHWGYDGAVHEGDLIVETAHAEGIVQVFAEIYAARFPIERMVPVAAYDGDDGASMRANNTSGYNCRTVAGSGQLSQHAHGRAIDVNPLHNPYVKGGTVDPPEGAPWADRDRDDPGMIRADDAVVQAFARAGWSWGGDWKSGQDYQHFSASGS